MSGMKKILTLLCALALLAACQDDLALDLRPGATPEGMTDIYLAQTGMPLIITRADAANNDDRVESVILFVFDTEGKLLNTPVQQSVTQVAPPVPNGDERYSHTFYRFRAYLPEGANRLHAVCNLDAEETAGLLAEFDEEDEKAGALTELKEHTLEISSADEAYKGVFVMEGYTTELGKGNIIIPMTRVASRHTFTVTFDPENAGDQFKLSSMSLFNVPARTKLVKDDNYAYENDHTKNWEYDAVHFEDNNTQPDAATGLLEGKLETAYRQALYLGTDPGDYPENDTQSTDPDLGADAVSGTEMLDVTQGVDAQNKETYTATAHLFENRRGGLSEDEVDQALELVWTVGDPGEGTEEGYPEDERERIRQLFKRDLAIDHTNVYKDKAKNYYACATCLVIEGIYDRATGATSKVRYFVYLGRNNFGDFNVERNTDNKYTITIRACDDIDTRIETRELDELDFTVSKPDQPFDAHYNVREALVYATNGWEVYVENPDQTPWLEVSTSAVYYPRPLGSDYPVNLPANGGTDDGRIYAQSRLKGNETLKYIYIHTDEYVPKKENFTITTDEDGNQTVIINNGDMTPRTGTIVAKCGTVETKFTVTQYPAQLVGLKENNIAGMGSGEYRYFFVERIPEEKYKNWGYLRFWNLTLDNLISTGYYDGLSSSRKEYVSAVWGDKKSNSFKARTATWSEDELQEDPDLPVLTPADPAPLELDGAQDAAYWPIPHDEEDEEKLILPGGDAMDDLIPNSSALGYALLKNRDRNGNGRIDYDEILWYLPARKQLQAIAKAINAQQLYGTDTDDQGELQPLALDGNYWSSTPSVSDKYGITTGRAYYVEMDAEGSEAIGLRDQSFNVIVCRDADDVWYGPDSGNGQGGVDLDPDWEDEEDVNMPGQKKEKEKE